MKTILAIDSTTKILSVSISENDRILSERKDSKNQKHMVNIINNVDIVLKNAGKSIKNVDLFSINSGPGDFTGTRIGLSIVKIFSLLSKKPVYGFNSLDVFSTGYLLKNIKSMAKRTAECENLYIIPLMDVRNDEIYFSIYEVKDKKDDDNIIFCFDFEDKKYYLLKKTRNFLFNSKEFNKKFLQLIKQYNCRFKQSDYKSKFNRFQHDKFFKDEKSGDHTIQTPPKDKNTLGNQKDTQIFLTANAVISYKSLLEELKASILAKYYSVKVDIDERNVYPDSKYLNYLSNYSSDNNLKPLPATPVYVRDFISLDKKGENKKERKHLFFRDW